MSTPTQAHWLIRKNSSASPEFPWFFSHRCPSDADEHFSSDLMEHGSLATHAEAVAAVARFSRLQCAAPAGKVAFYGLELGVNAALGRVCVLDVAGFAHLEEALAHAETLRGQEARRAASLSEADYYLVSPMDAAAEDMALPVAGATVYFYDPEVGTTWSQDLLSWERPRVFEPVRPAVA